MTFDSAEFLIFFAVIIGAWFFVRNFSHTVRNGFLLIASYFFYGYWSPPFVILLLISTFVDFYLAQAISRAENRRKTPIRNAKSPMRFTMNALLPQ